MTSLEGASNLTQGKKKYIFAKSQTKTLPMLVTYIRPRNRCLEFLSCL